MPRNACRVFTPQQPCPVGWQGKQVRAWSAAALLEDNITPAMTGAHCWVCRGPAASVRSPFALTPFAGRSGPANSRTERMPQPQHLRHCGLLLRAPCACSA